MIFGFTVDLYMRERERERERELDGRLGKPGNLILFNLIVEIDWLLSAWFMGFYAFIWVELSPAE